MCVIICMFVPLWPSRTSSCAQVCDPGPWAALWHRRHVRDLLLTKLVVSLVGGLWTSMSTEYARSVFLLSEVELDWLVSLQLCTSMLAQGIDADLVNASP